MTAGKNRRAWPTRVLIGALCFAWPSFGAAATPPAIQPADWHVLAEQIAEQGDTTAEFQERRFFSFRKEPVVLRGEVRISATLGLSLRYTAPEERTVIIDSHGMLLRDRTGKGTAPPDPRAKAANDALRHALRLDVAALGKDFEISGEREEARWTLRLLPREAATRRAIGEIHLQGTGAIVHRIALRRSEKQQIEIAMENVRRSTFTAEEIKRYFR